MSTILEVHIVDSATPGPERTLRFSKSPVRIGRNQLNDISLQDPFVSEWHGIIRFDNGGVAYFDLGSTNGSLLDRQRLAKNIAAVLSPKSKLQLGFLTLTVSKEQSDSGLYKTVGWSSGAPGQEPRESIRSPLISPPAHAPVSGRRATSLGLSVSDAPSPDQPRAFISPPSAASRETRDPPPAAAPERASRPETSLEERYVTILEAFSEAFIGLREGYEQFGTEVGVRIVNGTSPLHRARTGREVLEHVLSPTVDPTAAARDLTGIFADFAIHNIAMMEGITEGARALLQSLDPRANEVETGPRLLATTKSKHLWKSYLERFEQMVTEDEQLHAAIFGEEFARAYASVTLGDANDAPKGRR